MTETETQWIRRVEEWRTSGSSAEVFSTGKDYKASTLRYWASKLKGTMTTLKLAKVVRAEPASTAPVGPMASAPILIELAGARIHVPAGADMVLLHATIVALRGGQ